VPAQAVAGSVDITITTLSGTSAKTAKDHYRYTPVISSLTPNSGSVAGGETIEVGGIGFAEGTNKTIIQFGTSKATSVTCTSNASCSVRVPPHAAGSVEVKATVNKAVSTKAAAAIFTYH